MKNNDCLFSDIQNLCNAVSDWLIPKINNPVVTSCVITAEPVNLITHIFDRPHDKTNTMTCAPSEDSDQPGHSTQSDQSLRCPHEEALGPSLPITHTAKTLFRLI